MTVTTMTTQNLTAAAAVAEKQRSLMQPMKAWEADEEDCSRASEVSCLSEVTTDVESGDDTRSSSPSCSNEDGVGVPLVSSSSSLLRNRVHFADEVANGGLIAEVLEVECLKDLTRFTPEEREEAEHEWCWSLLQQLEAAESDSGARFDALERLEGAVFQLSLSWDGCLVVQQAFQAAKAGKEQDMLASELHGQAHIHHLVQTPTGCEVLQTCLEYVRPEAASFIAEALRGVASRVARLEDGSQVLCRIFEHLPSAVTAPLMHELIERARLLCYHTQGNLVLRHVLEYGTPEQQLQLCQALAADIGNLLRHSLGRCVVEKALTCSCEEGRNLLHAAACAVNGATLA